MLAHTSGLRDWIPLLDFNRGQRGRGDADDPAPAWAQLRARRGSGRTQTAATCCSRRCRHARQQDAVLRVRAHAPVRAARDEGDQVAWTTSGQVIPNRALAYEPQGKKGWRMATCESTTSAAARARSSAPRTTSSPGMRRLASMRLGHLRHGQTARTGDAQQRPEARLTRAGSCSTPTTPARFFMHSGSTDGYGSILARFPARSISVAVLCNAGETSDDRDGFAARIFDLFALPQWHPSCRLRRHWQPRAARQSKDSTCATDRRFSLQRAHWRSTAPRWPGNGRLGVRRRRPAGEMAVTKDRFRNARPADGFMSNDVFELTFLSSNQFELRSMEGQTTRVPPATAYAPTAADLKVLFGRYDSDELRATLEVTSGKAGVMARLNDSPESDSRIEPGRSRHLPARHADGALPARQDRQGGGSRTEQSGAAHHQIRAAA